jgi:hemerythrin
MVQRQGSLIAGVRKMGQFKWRDAYSVHVDEIDDQHKTIIDMCNTLQDAIQTRKSKEVVGDIIKKLFRYAQTHFICEEKYFKQLDYPDADEHIVEHHKFVDRVFKLMNDYEKDRMGLTAQVMEFLQDWLDDHIQTHDKKYAPFFFEHGLR